MPSHGHQKMSPARVQALAKWRRDIAEEARNEGSVFIFMRTYPINHGNGREHWGERAKRTKSERFAGMMIASHSIARLPCRVTFTRYSNGTLDSDAIQGCFKGVRDGIADYLGVPDNDSRIEWVYADQAKSMRNAYGINVKIEVTK